MAGAPDTNEIEITPDMIEAGVNAISRWEDDYARRCLPGDGACATGAGGFSSAHAALAASLIRILRSAISLKAA
jgi:hypothetical protein